METFINTWFQMMINISAIVMIIVFTLGAILAVIVVFALVICAYKFVFDSLMGEK